MVKSYEKMRKFYEVDGWIFNNVEDFYNVLRNEADKIKGKNGFELNAIYSRTLSELINVFGVNPEATTLRQSTASLLLKFGATTVGLADLIYDHKLTIRENPLLTKFQTARLRAIDCDEELFEKFVEGVLNEKTRRVVEKYG